MLIANQNTLLHVWDFKFVMNFLLAGSKTVQLENSPGEKSKWQCDYNQILQQQERQKDGIRKIFVQRLWTKV